ncbi:DUF4958 family protein, partial [Bacteroides faecis]|uniref:surface glycan-binding family protein n=2 Tax=Bacteroides TaxID=816 RepID=UPI00234D2D9E
MRSKLQNITSRFLAILMVVGLCVTNSSCTDPETTDSTKFALFYAGITDIGPSMSFNLDAPTYIGGAPSDFAITRVTLNGETYDTNSFAIDTNTGSISLSNTSELPVGLYTLSVSCYSNGNYYEFKDIVTINMMKPVPDGISVEPNKISAEFADIISTESTIELPTAQVTTEGDHISIQKYIIANVRKDGVLVEENDFFTISSTGEISIVKGESKIQPGKYVLDLKLTTAIVDEAAEEGIFENAIEIDITSKPLTLTYTPNTVKVEENAQNISAVPTLVGSSEGLTYAIKSVSPTSSSVTIDPVTGVITLAANNQMEIGTTCEVSVTVTNQYGSTDFENAYTMTIVEFINPITKFEYSDTEELIQATAFEHPVKTIDGDEVSFSFVNLDSKLSDLTIDATTGTISAKKGNNIPVGQHTVTVLAKNNKSELQASFKLNIKTNPYYFTYVHWGNNLNLSPAQNYASQYRVTSNNALLSLSIPVAETDIPEGVEVEWTIDNSSSSISGGSIDENGTITFTAGWTNAKVLMILVKATTGKGTAGEITIKTPVFIHCSGAVAGVTVNYTPFVFQVNPRTGGSSVAPTITGTDLSTFIADYRRTFNYYNINGP